MAKHTSSSFKALLEIIGINPFVFVPEKILKQIFKEAGKNKGAIPVRGSVNDLPFRQTLLRYKGDWRLYINTTMLKQSPKRIGESIRVTIEFDPEKKTIPFHPKLKAALKKNPEANAVFKQLSPSRQKEIKRYIASLKSDASVEKNILKAIQFLLGKERFGGRERS